MNNIQNKINELKISLDKNDLNNSKLLILSLKITINKLESDFLFTT